MNNESYNVIGVMSGTSLDGLDLCYMKLEFNDIWSFDILKAETYIYSKEWKKKLSNGILLNKEQLDKLDFDFSLFLSSMISKFIKTNEIEEEVIVCSHGHTVFHRPEIGLTKQIGNLFQITSALNSIVVCDFRVQDVQLGGQGAPLVPIGDKLLFGEYDFCLNLGGFANISFEENSRRFAFDICAVNIVLNNYSKIIGLEYDLNGENARKGVINDKLLNRLNALDYYKQDYPKSLGLEWVKKEIFPLIESFDLEIKNILRTFVEHTAIQISKSIASNDRGKILLTGGGVFNAFLIQRIDAQTKHQLIIPSDEIINYKEALIFGLLGILKLRNEVNCLSSVTGVTKDHSSGKVFK